MDVKSIYTKTTTFQREGEELLCGKVWLDEETGLWEAQVYGSDGRQDDGWAVDRSEAESWVSARLG